MNRFALASFCLRAGLAVVFLYAAVAAFIDPDAWVGFIPSFIRGIIPARTFLVIHSVGEIILGLWLLSGAYPFAAGILAAGAMASIVLFNLGSLDIVFRDIAILFMALALAVISRQPAGGAKEGSSSTR